MAIYSFLWIPLKFVLRVLVLGLVCGILYALFRQYTNLKKFKQWPGPKPLPIIGTTREVLYGGVKWVRHMSKKHGKVFVAWTFSEPLIFVCDPSVIRFLSTDTERVIKVFFFCGNFVMRCSFRNTMSRALGLSILTSEADDFWRSHRKILNVFFNYSRLCAFLPRLCELSTWAMDNGLNPGGVQDIQSFSLKLGLIIFGDFAFHWDYRTDPSTAELLKAVDEGNVMVAAAIQSGIPLAISPAWRRFQTVLQKIRSNIHDKMDRRLEQLEEIKNRNLSRGVILEESLHKEQHMNHLTGEMETLEDSSSSIYRDKDVPKDIATVLLEAKLEKEQMVDEILTLLSAGHETTAHFIAFVIYSLAQHQDIQTKLFQEIQEVMQDRTVITREDIQKMKYLTAVCNESLRWWNVVANIPREAAVDIDLSPAGCNLIIPRGATIVLSPAVVHRDEDFWGSDASMFVPERWLSMTRDHNSAFFPFGFGKRICIGQTMALLEGAAVVALFVKKFHIGAVSNHKPKLWMAVATKSENGLPVSLTPRAVQTPVSPQVIQEES